MADLVVYETGNGGDVVKKGNDLQLTEDLFNQVYLAWFGGNVEASTTGEELPTEQRFDWWGNQLFFQDKPEFQFNSELERVLDSVALTSSGRVTIEEAAKRDLKYLEGFAEVSVSVSIIGLDQVQIDALLKEPDNIEAQIFRFIWDKTKGTLIEQIKI